MGKLIALLKHLVQWAEARWPEKLEVTRAEYERLSAQFAAMCTDSARLDAVVRDIKLIATALDVERERMDNLVRKLELAEKKSSFISTGR